MGFSEYRAESSRPDHYVLNCPPPHLDAGRFGLTIEKFILLRAP